MTKYITEEQARKFASLTCSDMEEALEFFNSLPNYKQCNYVGGAHKNYHTKSIGDY